MPKKQQPATSLLKCTRCSFCTKNRYIYNRHNNRCSKVDIPGLSKDYPAAVAALAAKTKITTEGGDTVTDTSYVDESMDFGAETDEVDVTGSQSTTEDEPGSSTGLNNNENEGIENEEFEETDMQVEPLELLEVNDLPVTKKSKMPRIMIKMKSGKHRGQPHRNYSCENCDFDTKKSKTYLYHLLEKHNGSFSIFPCTFCEYACRWKHKLLRHMKMVHKNKTLPQSDDLEAEILKTSKPKADDLSKIDFPVAPKVTIQKSKTGVLQIKKRPASVLQVKKKSASVKIKITDKTTASEYIVDLTKTESSPHFKCKLCAYSSRMKARVYNHVMACHINAKEFHCRYCSFITTKKTEYYAHNAKHENQKVWSCEDCAYTTSFKPNYLRHRVNHNRNSRFKCSICTYTSDHEGALKRHVMYSHSLTLQNLAGSYMAESHMEEDTTPNISANVTPTVSAHCSPVKDTSDDDTEDNEMFPLLPGFKRCESCGFLGMSDEEVDEHVALHNQNSYFPCQICRLRYKRAGDLNRHMKLKHNLRLKDFIRRQGTRYQIEISLTGEITVPSITGAKSRIVNKENISYNAADGSYGISQDDDDDEIQFRDKGDDQPLDLSMPSPDKSPSKANFDPENLQCSDCVYIAKWPSDLRRHSVVHTVEKRFKCKFCDKKYKYAGDLNVHMRRDHSEEQGAIVKAEKTLPNPKRKTGIFKCSSCSYTSLFKSELERHSHSHTDDKPHNCILCDYESHWKGDVKRHIQKHHPAVMSSTVPVEDFIGTSVDDENLSASGDHQDTHSVSSMMFPVKQTSPAPPPKQAEKKIETSTTDDSTVKEPIFKCKYCEFTASAPSKLKAHVITHVNLKQWKCPVCPRRSNWKWDIRKHLLKDHPDCTVTNVIMLTEEEAKATIQDYISKSTMPKRENHLDNLNIAEAQDELKFPYRCSLCDFVSAYRWEVSKHLRISHHGENCSVIVAFSSGSTEEDAALVGTDSVKQPSPKTMDIRKLLKQPPLKAKIAELLAAKTPTNDQSDNSRKRTRSKKADENFKSRLFMCGDCGKRCSGHGDVKKHYKYIHPDKQLKVIYLGKAAMTSTPNPQPKTPSSPAFSPSPSPAKGGKRGGIESKYNNPKAIGYIKPFQCSVCLRRSNWKWDINKHMRETHQGVAYHLIVLPEDVARSSLATYIPPMQQQAYKRAKLAQQNADALQPTASPSPPTPKQVIRNLKQFMCSLCHYRSDWRSDTHRHIKNKHGRNTATIIMLDPSQAKATLGNYVYKRSGAEKRELFPKAAETFNQVEPVSSSLTRRPSVESGSSAVSRTEDSKRQKTLEAPSGKLWKCSKCPYSNKERRLVSMHLKTHKMKPFNCKICGHSSNYRSALYRHLRGKHNSNDFSLCHVPMKYSKGSQIDFNEKETENLTMEELEELEAGRSSKMNVDNDFKSEEKPFKEVLAFQCTICKMQTTWRSVIRKHLREKHGSTDFNLCVTKPLDPSMLKKKGRRKFACAQCPYESEKQGLLKFHMANHKPQPGNRYKCKYCPYYVCAKRLLHQHLKLHAQATGKVPVSTEPKAVTPKRYQCEKCPFKTGSKNDILYHKQFHRPRPSANFKCDYCEYWVTHKRLLKQHYRIHKSAEMTDSPIKSTPFPAPVMPSPCKSEMTDASWFYNPVDAASIKQQVISSKITRTLTIPGQSPAKPSSGPAGYVVRNGVFRKLNHCRYCPYMNTRGRNLRLHEKMHGWRLSDKPLFQCASCNYTVGSKGLLSHHMKVHMKGYGMDPNDNTTADLENLEGVHVDGDEQSDRSSEVSDQQHDHRMDALLEIARFKKYACEKCPYASAKRNHFERHLELHGSKQRYICDFCDYSVPSNNLLLQHQKLHLMPNQNLLAVQSISNLQHLPEITADVAVASFLSAYNPEKEKTINVTHDHMELYENHPDPPEEPKKLYRCDRCPYANVRRDYLLAHLKFHMVRSDLTCSYCDYSVSKSHLLHQHIKVHFSPLPEFSEWLEETGIKERKDQDKKSTNEGNQTINSLEDKITTTTVHGSSTDDNVNTTIDPAQMCEKLSKRDKNVEIEDGNIESAKDGANEFESENKEQKIDPGPSVSETNYICQYCDREFTTSEQLVSHEMQHLIGNHFEANQPMELPSPVQEMTNLETMETPLPRMTDTVTAIGTAMES